ncbi:MAG: hypothetical protein KatS3mg118_1872 [Paracoccaceae bacterium]|nr:MAG: hypothetical protein KatS3mg118_1872 [Paracoccaceae bacterium]
MPRGAARAPQRLPDIAAPAGPRLRISAVTRPMVPVICLPGLLCDGRSCDPLRAELGETGRAMRVAAIPAVDSFEAMAARMGEALPPRAVLVGMSMGSYLALALACRHPAQVAGLVLIGTTAAADSPRAALLRRLSVARAAREGMAALADAVADAVLSPGRRADPALRARIRAMAEATGPAVFAAHQKALAARPDQTGEIARIRCPVLVLTGSEDRVTPPEAGRAVARGVARGRFVLLKGAGHLPALEAPGPVARQLAAFLDRLAAEPAP